MSTATAPLTFDAPVAEMWADDIMAKRHPDPWRAVNGTEMLTFSSKANADKLLQLAKAVTPDAKLVNGPDEKDPNFIKDAIDTAVTYMVMHGDVDFHPWAIQATYNGRPLVTYVAGLVREHEQHPDSTQLAVTTVSGKADYDWV